MSHPAVVQLRFARSELLRGLEDLPEDDGRRRIGPANSIAWNIGHLAWQEQRYWLVRIGGLEPIEPRLDVEFCFGCPSHDAGLGEMWAIWRRVRTAADPILDGLDTAELERPRSHDGQGFTAGSLLYRTIYHYWFHLGESMGLRQAMGHAGLAQFVGRIDEEAPFVAF
jgi:hypothetical protein